MQKIKNISLVAVSVITILTTAGSVVAFAQDGSGSGSSGDSTSSSGSTSTPTPTQMQQELQDRQRRGSRQVSQTSTVSSQQSSESETEHSATTSDLRKRGEEELAEKKKNLKEKSQEERQKTCEQRKKGIETKFDRISTNTQKVQDRIDTVLDKATTYADKNNLNSGDIAGLITTANAAKSKSASSVANLKTLKPTIDCTSNTVPSDIATFKAAAKEARDNLKSYRTAVKNLLKALIDGSKTSNPTGSSDNTSNTTQEGTR